MSQKESKISFREKLHEIIFEADTTSGKAFDIMLIASIVISVIIVMLDSVKSVNLIYGNLLFNLEWFFTILFTIEYLLRLYTVNKSIKYATSFFGVVDLLAILPTYIGLFFPATRYFTVIRILRVLRIFRVLKFVQYLGAAKTLLTALKQSRRKITVFIFTVLTLVIIFGSLMYIIEGEKNGFTSIPRSIYWAIVTLTTVGYGDISPNTPLGQAFAAFIMILGYGIIAVPTGIVTAELSKTEYKVVSTQVCKECSMEGHDIDAKYCKYCGSKL
ncbi:MAG: ion transporter [Ignavibacteriae bacterium]|nr:ion transporter [Ignavibacteriota bacterium]MCB9258788.1 ion transporter [Ignavibacteriales bacterium]